MAADIEESAPTAWVGLVNWSCQSLECHKARTLHFIAAGSITHRHTRCGKPNCRCHANPPQLHGPYWQWTAKINGKTVTRRLTPVEVGPAPSTSWIAEADGVDGGSCSVSHDFGRTVSS